MTDFVIPGIPVRAVSMVQAEFADFVVCVFAIDWTPFTDNVQTTCAHCGIGIQHRPFMPALPKKICVTCAMALPATGTGRVN